MSNLLQRSVDRLEQRRSDAAAVSVVYARGATTITIDAAIGRTPFEQRSESGITHINEHRDFLILIADLEDWLALRTGGATPIAGDTITLSGQTFTVMSLPGEPVFRTCGGYGATWRIHTKRTA